jgi:hypothetical protein
MFLNEVRRILRMKKLILLSAVLFGTAVASQAGVHVDIGIGLPFPPIPLPGRVIVSRPAPVIVERAPVCPPAPVYVEPRYCPPPRVVYVEPRGHYSYPSHHYGHSDWGNHGGHSGHNGGHSGWDNRGGHRH